MSIFRQLFLTYDHYLWASFLFFVFDARCAKSCINARIAGSLIDPTYICSRRINSSILAFSSRFSSFISSISARFFASALVASKSFCFRLSVGYTVTYSSAFRYSLIDHRVRCLCKHLADTHHVPSGSHISLMKSRFSTPCGMFPGNYEYAVSPDLYLHHTDHPNFSVSYLWGVWDRVQF